jgi:transposase
VIHASELTGIMSTLFWLSDEHMARLRPFFPKSHGSPRVDDRGVLSRIIFINRNGLRWSDAPKECGPHKTLYNRWKRWSEMGVIGRLKDWRRIATRCDRCPKVFLSAVALAASSSSGFEIQ